MKKYFGVNRWIFNDNYSPKFFGNILIEISEDEDNNYKKGDRIFLSKNLLTRIHKAIKQTIIEFYEKDKISEVSYADIFDLYERANNLYYLSVAFTPDNDYIPLNVNSEKYQAFKERYINEKCDDGELEANLDWIWDYCFDFPTLCVIRVSEVSYDLERKIKVYNLEVDYLGE